MIAIGIQFEYVLLATIFHHLKNNWLYILYARHVRQLVVVIELWNRKIINKTYNVDGLISLFLPDARPFDEPSCD